MVNKSQKQQEEVFLKRSSKKFRKIHRKHLCSSVFSDKVAGLGQDRKSHDDRKEWGLNFRALLRKSIGKYLGDVAYTIPRLCLKKGVIESLIAGRDCTERLSYNNLQKDIENNCTESTMNNPKTHINILTNPLKFHQINGQDN